MIRELFTIGYEGSRLADVVAALSDAGVTTLLDVREAPWSRRPEFTKRALGAAMAAAGIGYRHMKALGTPKAGRDAARADRAYAWKARQIASSSPWCSAKTASSLGSKWLAGSRRWSPSSRILRVRACENAGL